MSHLLWVFEVQPEGIIILLGGAVGIAGDGLDVRLQRPVKELIDLPVVIVVVTDAVQRVDVVPDGSPQERRVNLLFVSHAVQVKKKYVYWLLQLTLPKSNLHKLKA